MEEPMFTVSLRVFHLTYTHEAIVDALGLKAEFSHTVGRPRRTPTGAPLEGLFRDTYCCFTLLPKQQGDFMAGIRGIFPQLISYRNFLRRLTEDGGRAELFVGVFASGSSGFTLKASDMSTLADIALELSVETYP